MTTFPCCTPVQFGSSWGRESGSKSGLPPDPWTATPDGEGTGGPLPLQLSMSDEELCTHTPSPTTTRPD